MTHFQLGQNRASQGRTWIGQCAAESGIRTRVLTNHWWWRHDRKHQCPFAGQKPSLIGRIHTFPEDLSFLRRLKTKNYEMREIVYFLSETYVFRWPSSSWIRCDSAFPAAQGRIGTDTTVCDRCINLQYGYALKRKEFRFHVSDKYLQISEFGMFLDLRKCFDSIFIYRWPCNRNRILKNI